MLNSQADGIYYAGFGVRLAAYLIDSVIKWTIIGFFWLFFIAVPSDSPFKTDILFSFNALDIAAYLLGSFYFVIFTYNSGSTAGKLAMNLRVVNKNGEKLQFIDVLYRETIGRYISNLGGIGYISILFSHKKQGFHDMLCDTCVVYALNANLYRVPAKAYNPVNVVNAPPVVPMEEPTQPIEYVPPVVNEPPLYTQATAYDTPPNDNQDNNNF